jgi:hypothetical protein
MGEGKVVALHQRPSADLAIPEAPEALAVRLRGTRKSLFNADDTFKDSVEIWRPSDLPVALVPIARAYRDELAALLAPAPRDMLLARILALLCHFPSKDMPNAVEAAIAQDWAEDLGEFPFWAVEQAARQWRRTKRFRPTISEMRDLCLAATRTARTMLERVSILVARAEDKEIGEATKVQRIAAGAVRKIA